MSEKKTASDELLKWMDSFRAHLDVGESSQSTMIYKTLKDNNQDLYLVLEIFLLEKEQFQLGIPDFLYCLLNFFSKNTS
jgi:hypothetical protein